MTLNPPDSTSLTPVLGAPARCSPAHPRFALEDHARHLDSDHPRMAQEIRAEAARFGGLSARVAWEKLQAEAPSIELRHLFGRGNSDRNRWLAQLIRDLPEPPVLPASLSAAAPETL